ncbi:MAG TPA: hydrogenase maturation protease [Eggerthellaceae bacterium]|nr:hydrogenase maturation protease [Eggerthellaceae bacterium]
MNDKRIAVFCVGNRLHLDDGVGPAVYDAVRERYEVPDGVELFDLGVLTMDMINYIDTCDAVITVDAMEHSGEEPGTVLRGSPEDLAEAQGANMSLHDLRLKDLFDAAMLLGYDAEGICLCMQVENTEPEILTEDLTPRVKAALPLFVETLAAELARLGCPLMDKTTGLPVTGPDDTVPLR